MLAKVVIVGAVAKMCMLLGGGGGGGAAGSGGREYQQLQGHPHNHSFGGRYFNTGLLLLLVASCLCFCFGG